MPWDPTLYNKFKKERFAPFLDLQKLITVRNGLNIIDLGCGTGELSRALADSLPDCQLLGIDSSDEMLKESKQFETEHIKFRKQKIEEVIRGDDTYDLVFSYAALQWVDHHRALFPRLIKMVSKGGQLVVQMPSNHEHYTHVTIKEIANTYPYNIALDGWARDTPVLTIEGYTKILFDAGGEYITVYEKIYPHVLEDANALADWTSGTALVPYLERLPKELHDPFITKYKEGLQRQYNTSPVFYPFNRILMAATF
jgi:trans-aconitate 2-methyltransferase